MSNDAVKVLLNWLCIQSTATDYSLVRHSAWIRFSENARTGRWYLLTISPDYQCDMFRSCHRSLVKLMLDNDRILEEDQSHGRFERTRTRWLTHIHTCFLAKRVIVRDLCKKRLQQPWYLYVPHTSITVPARLLLEGTHTFAWTLLSCCFMRDNK